MNRSDNPFQQNIRELEKATQASAILMEKVENLTVMWDGVAEEMQTGRSGKLGIQAYHSKQQDKISLQRQRSLSPLLKNLLSIVSELQETASQTLHSPEVRAFQRQTLFLQIWSVVLTGAVLLVSVIRWVWSMRLLILVVAMLIATFAFILWLSDNWSEILNSINQLF